VNCRRQLRSKEEEREVGAGKLQQRWSAANQPRSPISPTWLGLSQKNAEEKLEHSDQLQKTGIQPVAGLQRCCNWLADEDRPCGLSEIRNGEFQREPAATQLWFAVGYLCLCFREK